MGLISSIKAYFGSNELPPAGVIRSILSQRPFQLLNSSAPNIEPSSYPELASKWIGWVYVCSNRNADTVAEVPLRLYANTKKSLELTPTKQITKSQKAYLSRTKALYNQQVTEIVEVLEHPFLDLLKNINQFSNGFDFFKLLVLNLDLLGNAYIYVQKNEDGMPIGLWQLPAIYMRAVLDEQRMLAGWICEGGMNRQAFKQEEIIHIKHANVNDPIYGMGCLQAVISQVDLDILLAKFETNITENEGRPSFFYKFDSAEITAVQQKQLLAEWEQLYNEDSPTRRKFGILPVGIDAKTIALTSKDMQILATRQFNRQLIAAAFGVPEQLLVVEDVNRASGLVGFPNYARLAIAPRLKLIQEKLNEQLIPMYGEPNLFCQYDEVIPQDMEFCLKTNIAMVDRGAKTINEWREEEGLNPVAWGNEPMTKPTTGTPSNPTDATNNDIQSTLNEVTDAQTRLESNHREAERITNE